jgi:hypothetical protein
MDFHAFMYVTIGRRHELERGMAGKDPVLYRRMLDEIAEYARICDATGWSGIGIPEHHLQVEGFELGQDPGLMAMFLGQHAPRLRINQFGYVLPTHNPLRVAEHAATLDHLLGGRLNVAFVRGYQARWFENYAAVPGVRATGPWNRKTDEDAMNRELPPLLIGDVDTVTRMIENAVAHVPFNEMFLLFGQGILEPDRCKRTLEIFAEKVIPRFR